MNPREIKFLARSPSNSILGRPTFLHGKFSSKFSESEGRFDGLLVIFGVLGFACLTLTSKTCCETFIQFGHW